MLQAQRRQASTLETVQPRKENWLRPQRILVATDLNDLGHILPFAIEQARDYSAEILIVHVLHDFLSPPIAPSLLTYPHPESDRLRASDALRTAARQAQEQGVACDWKLLNGNVEKQLEAIVDDWKPVRIIAGSHGTEKYYLHILGSNAERLFHKVAVPVLVVGPHVKHVPRESGQPLRILAPVSLKKGAMPIFHFIAEYAAQHHADVTLLHVIAEAKPGDASTELKSPDFAEQMLLQFSAASAAAQKPACVVAAGKPIDVIPKYAAEGGYDLILLGSITKSSFVPVLAPGTAYGVVCGASCPVLIIGRAAYAHHPDSEPYS